ncbi:MAG: peptidylprolyl isomerase [Gemmatimonadota bacterium]
MTQQAKSGDQVAVHYTGKLDSGEVFDSSTGKDPIRFELGSGQVIPGFERAVQGMAVGDTREIRIEPEDAYGQPSDELVVEVARTQLPDDVEPAVGMPLQVQTGGGQQRVARITGVADDSVTLDLNHPLAGRALNFELELMEIG